ncbi:MAG TPA: hypothetical protein VNH15_00505 [Elusimicrobiota bacterium]|nr:hypothetical protein [Elusimicrobiota bacterium]
MNTKIAGLAAKIADLERELEEELEEELERTRTKFHYSIEKGLAAFSRETRALHDTLRQSVPAFLWQTPVKSLLVAPVIYSLIIPLVLIDLWVRLYQAVCFPVYRIAKVERARYVILDRGRLPYLNWIERINCDYCGYANGLVAYVREVASRTEQYFCPIKHARHLAGAHARYQDFLDFGDAQGYKNELRQLRSDLRGE